MSVDFEGRPAVIHSQWGDSLVVVSSKERAQPPGSSALKECDTFVQGVLVTGERVVLSPAMEGFAACGAGPFDKNLYDDLAARAHKSLQSKP